MQRIENRQVTFLDWFAHPQFCRRRAMGSDGAKPGEPTSPGRAMCAAYSRKESVGGQWARRAITSDDDARGGIKPDYFPGTRDCSTLPRIVTSTPKSMPLAVMAPLMSPSKVIFICD